MAFIKSAPVGSTLEARVTQLEKNLKIVSDLANSSLLIAPYQRSPVAGELIAGRITTGLPPGQPSMTLDLIQTGSGSGPILTVSDGAFNRVQTGNLAAYTGTNGVASPAEYGLRVLDVLGNVLFDSINGQGLGTNAELGGSNTGIHTDAGNTWSTVNNGTFAAIPTLTTSLATLTRGGAWVLVGKIQAKVTAGTGFAYATMYLNGSVASAGDFVIFDSATAGYTMGTQVALVTLPTGVSTLAWYGSTEANTITGRAISWSLFAIPLTATSY